MFTIHVKRVEIALFPTITSGSSKPTPDGAMKWLPRRRLLDHILLSLFLRLKGFHIVAQRYETPVGLIDFVALKDKRLAFIEVKRRKTSATAAYTLPAKQRRRVLRAAQYWLSSNPNLAGYRIAFDVLLAPRFGWPLHITDAFPNAQPARP